MNLYNFVLIVFHSIRPKVLTGINFPVNGDGGGGRGLAFEAHFEAKGR